MNHTTNPTYIYTPPVRKTTRPINADDVRKLEHPVARYLHEACTYARPAKTKTERKFVALLLERVFSMAGAQRVAIDEAGNIIVDLRKGPQHRTMFTAHTDTVHSVYGTQQIEVFEEKGDLFFHAPAATLDADGKRKYAFGEVLGADDGAGIAVMLHLIASKVPALYVFFREEECGGSGSRYMSNDRALLGNIDRCISIDRAGYHDVITHQGGGRCCSDAFADALATALSTDDFELAFMPDATGVFTDSANLTDVIAECTNISCGYFKQHTEDEHQNVTWLCKLADRMVQIDWESLPVKRTPGEQEYPLYRGVTGSNTLAMPTTGQSKRSKKRKNKAVVDDTPALTLADLEEAIHCAIAKDEEYLRGICTLYTSDDRVQEIFGKEPMPDWALMMLRDDLQYGYHNSASQAVRDFIDMCRVAKEDGIGY